MTGIGSTTGCGVISGAGLRMDQAKREKGSQVHRDQMLEAAFLHTRIDCYFVGTYAQRVSFASQQYRALDLILALEDKIKPEMRVAVVGAGLAGLMACAVLRHYGAHVHLFEANAEILHRQKAADHRLIHPSITLWPHEKPQLSTNLPVFDWCAASCDRIIANLKREWAETLEPFDCQADNPPEHPLKQTVGAKINGYTRNAGSKEGRLSADEVYPWMADLNFDLVLVTTGYGAENSDAKKDGISYWTPDELIEKRDKALPEKADKTEFYVTGCGDGGLIDALRIVHGDFQNGWITIAIANLLYDTPIAEAIKAAERTALMWARSILSENPQDMRSAYENASVCSHLNDVYTAQAKALLNPKPDDPPAYREANDLLMKSVKKISLSGRVFLAARVAHPFVPNAAPIHKLLIAHALQDNRITYRTGTYFTNKTHSKSWIEFTDHQKVHSGPKTIIIPRHGPEAHHRTIIDSTEQQSLRLRQIMLADRINIHETRTLRKASTTAKALDVRLPYVQSMIAEIDDRYAVDYDGSAYAYHKIVEQAEPSSHCAATLGIDMPVDLFGISSCARFSETETFSLCR
ncbi:hypothetical protein EM6_3263 (plasmid) [Asticcacaulis excentricus]|uniref:Uncharacterized protein n=2 Tax=Asticcacaulis excentricus TaxID=78587 RepID=A0A3G9G5Q0_9CAUL|nr:hypothetical protein EM6_3263 [Asticcacaulis excentricus]